MEEPREQEDGENRAQPAPASEAEQTQFHRQLRRRAARGWPLAIGAAAVLFGVAIAVVVLRDKRLPRPLQAVAGHSPTAAQETPEWLEDSAPSEEEGGRGRRHRDDEGAMARPDSRLVRYGIEGPSEVDERNMAREEARELAAKAGIVGVLKASVGASNAPASSYGRDTELGNDPMSALGALMGDRIGANVGFSGLGLRGTGHGGGKALAREAPAEPEAAPAQPSTAEEAKAEVSDVLAAAAASVPVQRPLELPANSAADALFTHYSTLEGLQFQPSNGYFANTYLPGDAGLRGRLARLSDYDRGRLPPAARTAPLDNAVRRNSQPFDAPDQAALDVFLSASERGTVRERRMQLQIGLRATPRLPGRGTALNAGFVLDLREPLDADAAASLRALLVALGRAREPGDRFALFSAGRGAPLVAETEAFRPGPLPVLVQRLLDTPPDASGASLIEALQAAQLAVRGGDDPASPLGSSTLIVITNGAPDAGSPELLAFAQQSAVEGIPLSVFDLGGRHSDAALVKLALAGQGSLRRVSSARDAEAVVDRELSTLSRVVARALRLRIRLAPGVRLISVLGSERLSARRAQRVREAERSIDKRLSRNLGIQSDRGEDEEGIQIVIPSFEAGDSHVVLVDVVAPGPGPLADVSVRYKDLVRLDNGLARASLALQNRELPRGALELNVLKNVVAYELSRQLRAAGDAVDRGFAARAPALLDAAIALLDQLDRGPYGLGRDRDLAADRALLADYRALVAELSSDDQRGFAADSLHVASLLKVRPRPVR